MPFLLPIDWFHVCETFEEMEGDGGKFQPTRAFSLPFTQNLKRKIASIDGTTVDIA